MRQFLCYIVAFARENNLQQLQNLYEDLSGRVINDSELSSLVDNIYYALDYPALIQFNRDLETKGTSILSETIYFYSEKDRFGEFSNFYPSPFTLNGILHHGDTMTRILYPTVEHYFKAQKFMGPNASPRSLEYARLIISQNTPNKAKILGNQQIRGGYRWIQELNNIIRSYEDITIRPDWNEVRDNAMRRAILNKFIRNHNLLNILLTTNDKIIIEHTSRDNYWGDGGDGSGQNKLGKILMETRDILRYKVTLAGPRDYWVIRNILLIGYIDVPTLNKVGVKYLLDLSGKQTVSNKILGRTLPDPISVYGGQIIFVTPPDNIPLEQLVNLTMESLGKGYVSYIYANADKYQEILTILFDQLYELSIELGRELIRRLLQR